MSLFETLEVKAKRKRRRIGISILNWNDSIRDSLNKAKAIADIVVYGQPNFGFEGVENDDQEAVGRQMVKDLKAGKIDQFVRGQVDDFGTVDEFKRQFGVPKDMKRLGFGLMRDAHQREFWFLLISNPEGQTLEDKIRYAVGATQWLYETFPDFKPKVAVMATCRPGSYGRDPVMSKSYDEAEAVVKHLTDKDVEAKNVHIEIENAVQWANVIMAANGTIGNQIFRAILYLGGGQNLACPTVFPGYGQYEDDSRNEQDWYPHIVAAAAYVE
ncbi:MAG: hypothetical protein UY81_C0056G0008 [Candidatus Giovannonibacteria bacterium GW2011_GWA2_53_7]|uniref:Uncharacterized protein n=1 Tax=Candidatus Giovannonibacteria bacterium GW2011_GWA2_53_7 TaxID=1618650 RepID=A0A0G2A2C5_9BACT|nr:MAG: hypothetical protein UY81_C0056G0008 [Candidatus Giovannonibacteria bacterium GW2011_GWA2_53_7]